MTYVGMGDVIGDSEGNGTSKLSSNVHFTWIILEKGKNPSLHLSSASGKITDKTELSSLGWPQVEEKHNVASQCAWNCRDLSVVAFICTMGNL